MAVNTKMPLTNTADGYLCEGTDVRGSYFVIDKVANIPSTIAQEGSLCYCQEDDKFYIYNSSAWVEKQFGDKITVDSALSSTSTNPVQNKVVNTALAGKAASSHAHGNVTNDGTITSTAVSSATGVLVYDSNNKIQRATAANARSIIGAGTSNLALGETSSTAYYGDKGKVAYDFALAHNKVTHAPADAQKNVQSDWNATSGDALILNKPTSMTPKSHTHGNIANDGSLSTASMVVVTDANKKITTDSNVSVTELGYLNGVTSNIQTQLDGKAASSHGTHVSYSSTVTALASTSSAGTATTVSRGDHTHKLPTLSDLGLSATATELNYVDGVTSAIQTQLNGKAASSHTHGNVTSDGKLGTASAVVVTDSNKNIVASTTITTTELSYLDGVTSNIQTQLNSKGTSNLVLGTTSTTAAAGNHTHSNYLTSETSLSKGTDATATKTLSFGGTFTAVTDTAVDGHKITDTTTTFTMPSDRFFTTLLPTGTSIAANADLKATNYLKVGRYFCSKTADAATLKNCPVSVAFMMEVSNPLGTTYDNETTGTWVYRLRKITEYNTGKQFIQYCSVGSTPNVWTFGDWRVNTQAAFTIDDTDKNGGTAAKGSTLKPVYLNAAGEIQPCTYSLNATVPSGAQFTDTTYEISCQVEPSGVFVELLDNYISENSSTFTIPLVTTSSCGLLSPTDYALLCSVTSGATKVESSSTNGKIKINGVDTTVYTHPSSAGNKHIPSGGSSGQFLKYSSAGTAAWASLPAATSSALGCIKVAYDSSTATLSISTT